MRRTVLGVVTVAVLCSAVLVTVSNPAMAATKGIFAIDCFSSHSALDDPIVFPAQPGQSHLHDFYGNRSASAVSTETSMRAGATKCKDLDDKAGYWNPAGYMPSGRLPATRIAAYYVNDLDGSVTSFPAGLQMVGGNSAAAPAGGAGHVNWFCGVAVSPFASHPYECSGYDGGDVTGRVDFPTCWDGSGITRDHTAYADSFAGGVCPSGWTAMPRLSYRVHFGIVDPCAGATPCGPTDTDANVKLQLSSGSATVGVKPGSYSTLHADFWNTWNQTALANLVAACDNAHTDCGKIDSAPTLPSNPGLSATAGTGVVSLSWSPPGNNGGSAVAQYAVYRSTVQGAETDVDSSTAQPPPAPLATVTGTSFQDTSVSGGTAYWYRVAPINVAGEGRLSNEASATPVAPPVSTPPAAPTGVTATAGNTTVHLSWTAPSNGGSAITSYNLYRGTTPGGEGPTPIATISGTPPATSYDDTGLTNGTTYSYQVTAVNAVGESARSTEVSAMPRAPTATVPAAPVLTAKTSKAGGVQLTWTVPADGGSAIIGYEIFRRTSNTAYPATALATPGASSTSYRDTATVKNTVYIYEIRAVNSDGKGPFSTEASARAV